MEGVRGLVRLCGCGLENRGGGARGAQRSEGPPPTMRGLCLRRGLHHHARLAASDTRHFTALLGAQHVLPPTDERTARYAVDWLRQYSGTPSLVLRPGSTEDVSRVLAHCHARGLPVVPHGGNTGLVGGAVPTARGGEVVLSLERLNAIHSIDEDSGAVVCGAGVVLQALDEALGAQGLMAPLDLGAKGSCQVGGNVSTNAGGLRLLRYGSLHGSVLGLEVVLADGAVLDCLTTLRKDNVGLDVKQLFIGAEGALGIVTRVALLAAPRPASVNVALLGVASFDHCRALLRLARARCGEILSAVEFADGAAVGLALDQLEGLGPLPLGAPHPFYLFIETSGSVAAHDEEKLHGFLEAAGATGLVGEGVVAASEQQARRLWRLREELSLGIQRRGHVFKYDVSLPLPRMYALVEAARARLAQWEAREGVLSTGFGHLGDGNLHLNISTPGRGQPYLAALQRDIEPWVFDSVLAEGGSVSAEHGLGQAKAHLLAQAKGAVAVGVMRDIKRLLDPKGILNPGKLFAVEGGERGAQN